MRQYLRIFATIIMMASGVAAHAEQTNYDPAKVSDSLRAVFPFRLGLDQKGAERQHGHVA